MIRKNISLVVNYDMLGFKLKTLRTELGYSQAFCAEKLDISVPYYNNLESGRRTINLDNLVMLSRLFRVSLDELLEDGDTIKLKPADFPAEITTLISNLTAPQQEYLHGIVKVLVNNIDDLVK